jgi:hypothetical protein
MPATFTKFEPNPPQIVVVAVTPGVEESLDFDRLIIISGIAIIKDATSVGSNLQTYPNVIIPLQTAQQQLFNPALYRFIAGSVTISLAAIDGQIETPNFLTFRADNPKLDVAPTQLQISTDLTVQGNPANLNGLAFQANVLAKLALTLVRLEILPTNDRKFAGRVTLSGPAPGPNGVNVQLSSNKVGLVPSVVNVPAGQFTNGPPLFPVNAFQPTFAQENATITATFGTTLSQTIQIEP